MKKMKQKAEDIIILEMCTINDNHMMYGFWNKEHGRYNFLFFKIFCPDFLPYLWFDKSKFWRKKKWKETPGDIIILHKCTKNYGAILFLRYGVWRM